jgi:hypothetical protein
MCQISLSTGGDQRMYVLLKEINAYAFLLNKCECVIS